MLTARGGSRLPLTYNKKIGYHQRAFRGIRLLWLLSKIVSYFFIKKKAPSQGIFSLLFAASEGKEKTSRNQTREDAQGHGRSLTLTRAPGWDSLLGQVHRRVPWLWETRPRTWPRGITTYIRGPSFSENSTFKQYYQVNRWEKPEEEIYLCYQRMTHGVLFISSSHGTFILFKNKISSWEWSWNKWKESEWQRSPTVGRCCPQRKSTEENKR